MSNTMTIKIGGEAQPVSGLRMLNFTKTTGDLYATLNYRHLKLLSELGSQQGVQNDRKHHITLSDIIITDITCTLEASA